MGRSFRIEPGFYLFAAGMLLLLPLDWFLSVVIAAFVHELFHWMAVLLVRGRVLSVSVGTGGAVMEVTPMGRGAELLCALSGPAGSLILVLLGKVYPELALCGLVQGLFNLLPVFPLDGGRVLRCIISPGLFQVVEKGTGLALVILSIWAAFVLDAGIFPIFVCAAGVHKIMERKISCKQGNSAVQ